MDNEGYPVELVNRIRTDATSLIEEAMLLANECVAERLADEGAPAAFRVHEPPSPDNLVAAARVLADLGAISPQQASEIELGDPHAIEQGVEAAHGTPFEELTNALLLRAMQRAVYKPHNQGHFALGAPAYCHFTSPIRRYPDLLIHRALKLSLAREHLGKKAARTHGRPGGHRTAGARPDRPAALSPRQRSRALGRRRRARHAKGQGGAVLR